MISADSEVGTDLGDWLGPLADRLLGWLVGTAFLAALPCLFPAYVDSFGYGPFWVAIGFALVLAWVRFASVWGPEAKQSFAIFWLLGAGFVANWYTGMGGISVAFITIGVLFGYVLLSRRAWTYVAICAGASVLVPAALELSGVHQGARMTSVQLEDWLFTFLVGVPCIGLGMLAITSVFATLDQRSELLSRAALSLETELRRRKAAQTSLQRLNVELEHRIQERSRRLVLMQEETEFLCNFGMLGFQRPLTAVKERVDQLIRKRALSQEGSLFLVKASQRLSEMLYIVEGFKVLGAPAVSMDRRSEVDVSAIALRLISAFRENDSDRQVETEVEPGIKLLGDPTLIEGALRNLIENSWKFTAGRSSALIRVRAHSDESGSGFAVEDNGPGFASSEREDIFAPFARTGSASSVSGLGIGLATVRRIAEQHRGKVRAESVPGAGATFIVTFGGEAVGPDEVTMPEPSEVEVPTWHPQMIDTWKLTAASAIIDRHLVVVGLVLILGLPFLYRNQELGLAVGAGGCLVMLAVARFARRQSFALQAAAAIIPITTLAIVMWSRTQDFSTPIALSISGLTIVTLLLGVRAMWGMTLILVCAAGWGFWAVQGGYILPVSDKIEGLEYWAMSTVVVLIGCVTSVSAVSQVRKAIAKVHEMISTYTDAGHQEVARREKILLDFEHAVKQLENRVLEREAELNRSIEALGTLTYTVGHDLRAPIRAVNGYLALIIEEYEMEMVPQDEALIRECLLNMRQVSEYVSEILELARGLQSSDLAEVELGSIAAQHGFDQSLVFHDRATLEAPRDLARLILKYLAETAAPDRPLEIRSNGKGMSVAGCDEAFLKLVGQLNQGSATFDDRDGKLSLASLALVRAFRRLDTQLEIAEESGMLHVVPA